MSYMRRRSQAVNQNVYLNHRMSTFMNPPVRRGDLYVERNEAIGNDLDVSGNLRIGRDLTARNYYANGGNFYVDNYLLIPPGTIIQSAAVTIPNGWLACDGASLEISEYENLFNTIGFTYGGDGEEGTFNLPDLRGRVVVGTGQGSDLSARDLADRGGEEEHVLTTNEMPSHSHDSNANGGSGVGSVGLVRVTGGNTVNNADATEGEFDAYAPPLALTINSTGGGLAHNNMQPFVVLHFLIKY